jgi:hypothetical protein
MVGLCAAEAKALGALADLPALKNFRAARESSYDPTGGNADGRHDSPLQPGETRTMADIEGAGAITHIWITIATSDDKHLRNMVLRMYWDGEEHPSVESPIGDFFGLGHGRYYQYASLPIQIGTDKGLNCYWRMPFSDGARITVTNEGPIAGGAYYYYVDYEKHDKPPAEPTRFHAQYRQAFPPGDGNYTFVEATGQGHFVGVNLSIHNRADGWWGEGDDMFYIDGDETPTLHGTGSEDYFCGAWCYGIPDTIEFDNLYFGAPFIEGGHTQNALWNVYRYHIEDPIPFTKSIRATIEHGHANNRNDDLSSVAYWYQTEPHVPFPSLPAPKDRFHTEATLFVQANAYEVELISPLFADASVVAKDMTDIGNDWSKGEQLLIKADAPGAYSAPLPTYRSDAGTYNVDWWYTAGPNYGVVELWFNDEKLAGWDAYSPTVQRVKLERRVRTTVNPEDNVLEVRITGKNPESTGYWAGLDCYVVHP